MGTRRPYRRPYRVPIGGLAAEFFTEPKLQVAAAEAVDREFVYIELEEASPTIPHITDPRSQSPRITPADARRGMLDARSQMPDPRVSF